MATIAEQAKAAIDKQTAKGLKKYGRRLDDNRADLIVWIDHAIEEAADMLQYLIKAKEDVKKLKTIIELHQDGLGAFEDEDYPNNDPITII